MKKVIYTVLIFALFSTTSFKTLIEDLVDFKQFVKVKDDLLVCKYEVSNADYRKFLNDLSFRSESNYLKAVLPDTLVWRNDLENTEPFVKYYFRNHSYDNYPVVGVSYDAANEYCKWLSEKYNQNPQKKYQKVLFKLLNKSEWIFAANKGDTSKVYTWGSGFIQNNRKQDLCNYKHTIFTLDSLKKYNESPDASQITIITTPVNSYYPNSFGIYNMCGNVAEMIEEKGFCRNIIGYMLKENQDITIEATLNSKNVNLNEILTNKEVEAEEQKLKKNYKLRFSEHINVNLNSQIEHLEFRKFSATNIRGVIKLNNKKLVLDPITLNTMNGTITTSGLIDGSDSTQLLVTCFSDITKINISTLFESLENFNQKTITDKNIKGIATAKVQFAAVLSPELKMDMKKLYAGVDMTIENGELNNVESMKSLSRFIELKDLENVRFSTLKNQIEIKNQIITIPKMEVKSTALNITASGTHTFNNEINYKVKLSLNELLAKKAKQAKKQNDEFGEVADDGLGRTNIFLSMTGTVDNPIIKYDSKGAIQNIKQDLKVEKQTLKSILHEEFGLFKKDSTLNNKTPKTDNSKFIIKWDEDDKKEEKKELKTPKKPEEEDFQ